MADNERDYAALLRIIEEQRTMDHGAEAVLRLGTLLMGAGTGGYRIIRAMKRAARALGFDGVDAVVSVNSITCTFRHRGMARTVVANRNTPAVDASRIEALENLSHRMGPDLTAEKLNGELDRVEELVTKRWAVWAQALAAGFACAGFGILNHYSLPGVLIVGASAAVGQTARHFFAHRNFNQIGTTAISAAVACLVFAGLSQTLSATGVMEAEEVSMGFVAAVLFLMPGFPLFSALLDLGRFDLTAGMSRLGYATTVIFTATMSAAAVSLLTGLHPLPADSPSTSVAWYAAATVASVVGIGGFAVLFNSSRRMALVAASIGAVANVGRLLLLEIGVPDHGAAFVGALAVGLLGAALARPTKLPRITLTVPASVIMIPGPALYETVYYLNDGAINTAIGSAVTASLGIIAIGAGLIAARILTDPAWTFGRHVDLSIHDRG